MAGNGGKKYEVDSWNRKYRLFDTKWQEGERKSFALTFLYLSLSLFYTVSLTQQKMKLRGT